MPLPPEKLIQIKNLTLHFDTIDGETKVLKEVELEIAPQQAVGLVGETGCGKSVTAKSVLGSLAIPPARIISGEILLKGENLLELSGDERRKVMKRTMSYIPQDPMTSLNPVFKVGQQMVDLIKWHDSENVGIGALLGIRGRSKNKPAKEMATELLDRVNIPSPEEVFDKYPVELSGGMRQRVLISMALIGEPEFLVADEPTTALDVTIQKGILDLLQERIDDRGLAVLYITHNIGVSRKLCDIINVMYAGTVVESAPTKELLENPVHPYTRGLVESIPKLTGEEYKGVKGRLPDYLAPPHGCRFNPRCQYSDDICLRELPVLEESVDAKHLVACHFKGELQ